MNDPNVEPVKLIDFDLDTLSEMAHLVSHRINQLETMQEMSCTEQRYDTYSREKNRALMFKTQLLNAFSRVKSEQTVTNS